MSPKQHQPFPSISLCDPTGRETQTVAADLDGTLLLSRSSFPYFLLLAVSAGSLLRGLLLLLLSPLVLLLYTLVSESLAIQLLIFVSVSGLKIRDIEIAARAVLPRFYAADVRPDSWRVFSTCARRVVVTANPTVMVEPFVREVLGGDKVLGTEIEVGWGGRATGFVKRPGVLVGERKKWAVLMEFGDEMPHLGLGDRETDHDFMAVCKEGYMVHPDPFATPVSMDRLNGTIIFHDGRLVQRPTPFNALLTFLWIPFGILLAIIRIHIGLPLKHMTHRSHLLLGANIRVRGTPPPPSSPGSLFICNHRTGLDPTIISIALGRKVSCVADQSSKFISSNKYNEVQLTGDHEMDAARISALLSEGDVVLFPEWTTCREPLLLQFMPLFLELSDRIVPVAINTNASMFHATTAKGWKYMDTYFFFMNPKPQYEVTFLDRLPEEMTCKAGKPAIDVAHHLEMVIGRTLGFKCTKFTRKDKYMMLGGGDDNEMEPLDKEE